MKQILCFGDSNTYGLIPGTTNQRYGWGTRWTSILDDKVRTKGYRVIEEGLCGRTTVFDDPFRTERRGTEMLDQINTVNPDAKILLVSPIYLGERIWEEDFDPEFDKNSIEVSCNLPRVYEKIARRRNISYLPASEFARPGEADQEHLDELGHSRLADAIYEKLAG